QLLHQSRNATFFDDHRHPIALDVRESLGVASIEVDRRLLVADAEHLPDCHSVHPDPCEKVPDTEQHRVPHDRLNLSKPPRVRNRESPPPTRQAKASNEPTREALRWARASRIRTAGERVLGSSAMGRVTCRSETGAALPLRARPRCCPRHVSCSYAFRERP